ncbi:MAG: DUF4168 domain-containing protein [Bacteroidales bacterium]
MHFFKTRTFAALFALAGIMAMSIPSMAQNQEYNDDELKKFANVVVEVISIQQQGQMQMISIIEDHEMSIQRFNEIMVESQEKPLEEIQGTEQEKEVFADISVQIMEVQEELNDQIIKKIEDNDMALERYEQILQAYQQSPELQERVKNLTE